MEIDMHSPSFRTTRSAKRARSPPSPSPVDRPLKRPSRGVNNHVAIPLPVSVTRRPRAQEDWVAQTRGLRIASPGFGLERVLEDAARDNAEEEAPLADTDMADEDTGGDDAGDEQMMSISPRVRTPRNT
ncbi:hypothetical protein A0H81_04744 [Grifola frondosa]|uniref:Uncharacterized protein n=1 Tax=Grifola frondosa TaxID=5627 RepID=A0A1C7MGA8_GRIFR|nr:hypothetical protein A0H81_04744 [Grifola frondosa]